MGNCLKAQEASFKSRDFSLSKNRDGWLGLFADDAVVQDPVGVFQAYWEYGKMEEQLSNLTA
jgi:hypothetical protein